MAQNNQSRNQQQSQQTVGRPRQTQKPSDQEVESDLVDRVVNEALDNDQRSYLLQNLERDDRLAEIFDNVLVRASEYSGEGEEVDGPGTETSDEVPARLSDGEFVFSSKAVDVIGEERLQRIMEQAESMADQGGQQQQQRQQEQQRGQNQEENQVTVQRREGQQPQGIESQIPTPDEPEPSLLERTRSPQTSELETRYRF